MQGDSCPQGPQNLPQVGTGVCLCNPASLPNRLLPKRPIPCPTGGGWAVGGLFFLCPRRSQDGEPAACRGGARQRGLPPQSPTLLSQRQHLSNLRSHPEMKPRTMEGQATQEAMAAPWGYLWFLHGTEMIRGIRRQPPLTCHFLLPRDIYNMNLSYPKVFHLF